MTDATQFDFDRLAVPIINVTISVYDDGLPSSYTYVQTFFFNITGHPEPPVNIRVAGGAWIYENSSIGEKVGQLICDNPETNEIVIYKIVSIDGDENSREFYMNGSSLYLNTTLQYDKISTHKILILAVDDGFPPLSSQETLSVTVKPIDPCATNTSECHKYATCNRLGSTTASCQCRDGFTGDGKQCYDIPECDLEFISAAANKTSQNLCANGGTCVDGIGNYSCMCASGWTGRRCREEIDECLSSPCLYGKCDDDIGRYFCSCKKGFTGSNCETNIDDCASLPCDSGTCIDGIDTFTCTCPPSYKGYRCSFHTGPCQHDTCPGQICVPRPTKGIDALLGQRKGARPDNSLSERYCTDENYVSHIKIRLPPGNDGIETKLDDDFERLLEDSLNVASFNSSGTMIESSTVYIVQMEVIGESAFVHFVVITDDGNNTASRLLSKHEVQDILCPNTLKHDNDFCSNFTTPSISSLHFIGAPSPSVKEFTLPIVLSLVAIAVVVGCGLLLRIWIVRKSRNARPVIDDGANNPFIRPSRHNQMKANPLYKEVNGTFLYKETDNPLYDSDDECSVDYEYDNPNDVHGVGNPLFLEDNSTMDSDIMCSNPLYESSRAEDTQMICNNPLYREDSTVNQIYEGSGNVYDDPQSILSDAT